MNQKSPAPVPGSVVALTVHGPRGVLDLTVPTGATLEDVARTYALEAGLATVPPLVDRAGNPLPLTAVVGDLDLPTGSVLVAVEPARPRPAPRSHRGVTADGARLTPSRLSTLWFCFAAAIAAIAGWCAAHLEPAERWPVIAVLLVAAGIGALPIGALRAQRVLAAPAFAASAALALTWDPLPERLPTAFGIAALCAAVCAGVGRLLSGAEEESVDGLRVWILVGSAWFVVSTITVLVGAAPQVTWTVLLIGAVLGARFVPELAVDVPDHYLLDLERLAVTAWSARERPTGRRGRIVVPEQAVKDVAARGARAVTAASVAILVVVLIATPMLLSTADLPLDRTGARCVVGFGAATLLFAARNHRHVAAARLLRVSGVAALTFLAAALLGGGAVEGPVLSPVWVSFLAVAVAGVLVLAAVFVGRGWRSAWWSRRAEIGEVLCGSLAVGSVVVAVGFFRHLWEVTG